MAIFGVVCQGMIQQVFNFYVPDGASFHGEEIVFLIYSAPVDDFAQGGFKHLAKSYAHGSPIAFTEGVGDVHLYIFFRYFIKGGLRHFVDALKS